MACNLAVSITKAAVENEQLLRLLTPALVAEVVKAALADLRYNATPAVQQDGSVYAYAGGMGITVRDGKVSVTGYNAYGARQATDAVSGALALAAEALLGQQIAATLAKATGKAPVVRRAHVENDGQAGVATVFTVKIGG